MDLGGFHHLTAVSADIMGNHRFYTHSLGLRLVKRSVNQDDVTAYHLFYADGAGSPGTDITFFDWPVPRHRPGTCSVIRTSFRVNGEAALTWWARRLHDLGVECGEITTRDGRLTLDFADPEGQRLALVDDRGQGAAPVPWAGSPVPPEYQLRGLGPIVMSVPRLAGTESLVTQVLNMRKRRAYPHPDAPHQTVHVYEMGDGGPHAELHVAVQPDAPPARLGAGGVHHVAFRTPDEASYDAWYARLAAAGVPNSGKVDRYWFRSLYLREPGGVLFEIATDTPGFAVDEEPQRLGERVVLPPFLEPRRAEILAGLKPID